MKVAVVGTGKIGCDLLSKIVKEPSLKCCLFIGRREESEGIRFAKQLGIPTSSDGISALNDYKNNINLIFDATSAIEHEKNISLLLKKNSYIINLTPAMIDFKCVPTINLHESIQHQHISMVTCGGQAVVPLTTALVKACKNISYIEAITSISSKSAGAATRLNIGQYQDITEFAIKSFSGVPEAKSILIINPAKPYIVMQTTIYAIAEEIDLSLLNIELATIIDKIKTYVPGYQLLAEPIVDGNRVVIMIKVLGGGRYLPSYAGNLDIITSAALCVAKYFAKHA